LLICNSAIFLTLSRLFFAGFLTTAGRGAMTVHNLLTQHPRHFRRVRDDVDRIVKVARDISADEPPRVEHHDFLNACITETARQHPIGTWIRWAEKPFVLPPGLDGEARVIPRGFVTVATESIRTDPRVYDNAEAYNPDRYFLAPFVSKSEFKPMTNTIRLDSVRAPPLNMVTTMQPSFGVGAHQCAGRLFAYRMIGKTPSFYFFLINSYFIFLCSYRHIHHHTHGKL
jgi:cytochrome P450